MAGMGVNGGEGKPNVIVVLADDFGYGSSNVYGADRRLVRTPHLDRLAREGMRFTDANTPCSVCSPTRYGLVTGRYPWRTREKYGVLYWWATLLPDPAEPTIADLMKGQGYATAQVGKWHLGYGDVYPVDYAQTLSPGPNDLGFDYHLGVPHQHGDIMGVYIENMEVRGLRSRKAFPYSRSAYKSQPFIGLDAPQRVDKDAMGELTEFAIDWIRRNREGPFFLYFCPVAVHQPITPSDFMRGMSHAGPYGDFIQDLDQSVGRLLEALDYLGLAEDTLFVFTSDNGGQIPPEGDLEATEGQAARMGLAINGNLRGDKHTIWEGGTRVPFLVRWPGKVRAGAVSEATINVVDMYATLADLLTGGLPAGGLAPDSYSFLPALLETGQPLARKTMVTQSVAGQLAIRMEGWKYVDDLPPLPLEQYGEEASAMRQQAERFQRALFHLAEDPREERDLIGERPEVAARLKEELDRLRKENSRGGPTLKN